MNPVLKTFLFLGALSALFVTVGYSIGGRGMATGFLIFSLVMNLFSYWFSEKIAIKMAGGKRVPEDTTDKQLMALISDTKQLSDRLNIPLPKIYLTEEQQANAFATGRNPKNSSICFTRGILEILDRDELRGVIGHELSHIKNRDVLIASIAAVISSAISSITDAAMWFGLGRDNEDSNPITFILSLILAPLAALLLQMAISRQREFQADKTGAIACGDADGLASALEKIEMSTRVTPMRVNSSIASLFIGNPLNFLKAGQLFSTHPKTEDRVKRLRELR